MRILTRSEWGAKNSRHSDRLSWTEIDAIVIHYTSAFTDEFPKYRARVKAIQNYHMNTNGWNDIAYNFLFSRAGDLFEGRGWNIMSAATLNHNSHTIAFCFLGADKLNRDDVTDKGRRALSELILQTELKSGKKIKVVHAQHGPPGKLSVGGHKDFVNTECPGAELYHFITLRGWEAYRKTPTVGYPLNFFVWAAWYLGEGDYTRYGPKNPKVRPKNKSLVRPLKPIYWISLKRFLRARNG